MLIPVTPIFPMTIIRRKKLLPVDGRILVRSGQKVTPLQVVAEANLPKNHLILNIASGLGLPSEKVDGLFHYKQGDTVSEGDILAGPVGITRRVVRAPGNGRVIFAGEGQLMLQLEQQAFELRAGMPGYVVALIPDRGVELQTTGALIQGAWGNEKVDVGMMSVIAQDRFDPLKKEDLDIKSRGAIIVGEYCNDVDVLHTAAELPIRGLILGGMASSLEPEAVEMPYPIILIDGFGELPMNNAAYNLLAANNEREIVVNAERFNRWESKRPEIIIPIPTQEPPSDPIWVSEISPNQRVKIVQGPYRTEIGTLITLRSKLEQFPSGLKAPAGVVRLDKGLTIVVPVVNLEILG
jgi:hypothetical protein